MSRKGCDLTGQIFGRLTALRPTDKRSGGSVMWECQCDCGNLVFVRTPGLNSNNTQSCGCKRTEQNRKQMTEIYNNNLTKNYEGTTISLLTAKLSSANTSGTKGVYWQKRGQCWLAEIFFKGKKIFLGYFKNKADAIKARKDAEEKYFQPLIEKYGG